MNETEPKKKLKDDKDKKVEKTVKSENKKKSKKIKKNITTGIAFVQATFNNTIVTITDDSGNDQENRLLMQLKLLLTLPLPKRKNMV